MSTIAPSELGGPPAGGDADAGAHGGSPEAPAIGIPTVIAIAAVACVLASMLHEGIGHGGACALEGGRWVRLTSTSFDCSIDSRFVDAGGTLVNLLAGGIFGILFRAARARQARVRFLLWLSMATNLMEGTSYLLFSGTSGIGDWADFIEGFPAPWAWRAGMAILGGVTYFPVVRLSARELRPFLGAGDDRPSVVRLARPLTLTPYFAGSFVLCLSGMFNPGGIYIELVSAAAASLGGMSGLLWMSYVVPPGTVWKESAPAYAGLARSWGWIACAGALVAVFVVFLGPGIQFGGR